MTPTSWARILEKHSDVKYICRVIIFSFIFMFHFRYLLMVVNQFNSLFELDFTCVFYQSHFHYANYFLKKKKRVPMILPDSLYKPTSDLSRIHNSKEQVFRSLLGTLTAALSCHQVVVSELQGMLYIFF